MKNNVNRLKVIQNLETNRAKHVKEFEAATASYQEECLTALRAEIDRRINDPERAKAALSVYLDKPESFVDQYDEAILKLSFIEDEIIELNETEVHQYLLDKWSWSKQFTMTNSTYLNKKA